MGTAADVAIRHEKGSTDGATNWREAFKLVPSHGSRGEIP